MPRTPNLLADEKSPYLLQHAHNPVRWHPWGPHAFDRARTAQKPIFLSIGYSTCHWCHVMERESFEDDAIAGILNEHFIAIKVDREERPDVDRIYMTALQAMGQHGGWPLSMFLTPDLQPFYGGTYFPPETRYGLLGFPELLRRIHHIWTTDREHVMESARSITLFLLETPAAGVGEEVAGDNVPALCYEQLSATYDAVFGGFGGGPKFPRPAVFDFLLRYHEQTGTSAARDMVENSLARMADGGVYDHIGGGFHRYAVDAEWRVPHFEKMLYDQAQLVAVFADAYRVSGNVKFAEVVRDILAYVLRDMTSPDGVFFSAEDADSSKADAPEEAGEGAFYLWSYPELHRVLDDRAGKVFAFNFGVEETGNAPVDPHHEFTGMNILYRAHTDEDASRKFGLTVEGVQTIVRNARERLRSERVHRPRPLRDDKVLVAWNGLMIGGIARASAGLGDPTLLAAASRAADFLLKMMVDPGGVLRRRFRDGEIVIDGQLEDYAFLIHGLIDLYEAGGGVRYLQHAVGLQETQFRLFADPERGGFFDTGRGDPSLLVRMKESYDGAEPAGNSVAADNLLRLSRLLGRPDWENESRRTVNCFSKHLSKQPVMLPRMAAVLMTARAVPTEIFLLGEAGDEHMSELRRIVHRRYMPAAAIHIASPGREQAALASLLPFAGSLRMVDGKPTAFVCHNFSCRLPTTVPSDLARALADAPVS